MSTLLLRLSAPMQAWGAASRFKKLTTEREPTKSGIIGLLAAALGRERSEDISDLCELRFGVRIDQPGKLLRDYHTAHNPNDDKLAFISERYYLCDAVFVVGLESDDEALLETLKTALQEPQYPLYLGRRSCPPSGRIVLGITQQPVARALEEQEWQAQEWYMKKIKKEEENLEIVMDVSLETPGVFTKKDFPVSFNQEFRKYRSRSLCSNINGAFVKNPQHSSSSAIASEVVIKKHKTEHDVYSVLEVDDVSFES